MIRFLAGVLGSLTLAAGRAAADQRPGFWMPVGASTTSKPVDQLFHFILYICIFFFLLIVTLMTFFVLRYRRRKGREAEVTATHNTALELTWTLIPLALLVLIFSLGFKTYMDLNTPPQNAIPIQVTAQRWSWQFSYPNGYVDGVLHVPVNTPIDLTLTSEDVIHSLFIPAFRVKKDAVPGRYNKAWFEATTPGEFTVFCAEYCGRSHSDMLSKVVVHEPGGYEKWMDEAANFIDKIPPVQAGERIFRARGCVSCHSTTGAAGVGPNLKGIFGHEVALSDGRKVPVDENYLRESILNPTAKVVAGFTPVMPTYQGRIKDKEITVIIEYLKSLQ